MSMKRESGFTLVEVLIAIAIGAVMLTGVFATLNSMVLTRSTVVGYSTPYAVGPQILDSIEADLKNAYFYDIKDNDGFWGADKDIAGREADGISFLTSTLGHVGDPALLSSIQVGQETEAHRRRSPTTEVQYVCRQSPGNPQCLELWRREDFYVDDSVHEGGVYRLVYDRVFDFKLEYVSRSTSTGGLTGSLDKTVDQMRRDSWSSIEERGLPRAVIVTISIWARDPESKWEEEPAVFVFRRWIPLPQVHESTQSEGQIASWDGTIKESTGPPAQPGKNKAATKNGSGFQAGGAKPAGGAANPFGALLQNRAPRGGAQNNSSFVNLFRPH
jgi:prepilin-type N-terminal cleavage/methylation domain-containing protein